jgi:acetyl esterase/lipase
MINIQTLKVLFTCLVAFAVVPAVAQKEILLWLNGAPGSEGKTGAEKVSTSARGEISISNVHKPSITPYLPAPGRATGTAIIIAPGGGHSSLKMDYEGSNLAKWLNEKGITAFVLKYRLARDSNSAYTIDDHAFADMQRAIRVVRSRAKEWNIDTLRIGVGGFSAGGELAGLAGMRFDQGKQTPADMIDRLNSRPDFQLLVYPGGISRLEPVKNSPPVFIVGGYGDRPEIAKGMALLYIKYKDAGIPAELHIYTNAVHGFGVRPTTKGAVLGWPNRFYEWLEDMGFLTK